MRTTISLNYDLLREAKSVAAASNRTFSELIEEALQEFLARRRQVDGRRRVVLPTFKGTGLQPGLDLDSSADLLDHVDPRDAVP